METDAEPCSSPTAVNDELTESVGVARPTVTTDDANTIPSSFSKETARDGRSSGEHDHIAAQPHRAGKLFWRTTSARQPGGTFRHSGLPLAAHLVSQAGSRSERE